MFCLRNQDITDAKAFFLFIFYVELRLNYMNDHRDDRSHFISTSIRFEALF